MTYVRALSGHDTRLVRRFFSLTSSPFERRFHLAGLRVFVRGEVPPLLSYSVWVSSVRPFCNLAQKFSLLCIFKGKILSELSPVDIYGGIFQFYRFSEAVFSILVPISEP